MLLFVLILAAVSVGAFAFFTEERIHWKVLLVAILALSVCFQFVPGMQTHFIVPTLMQVFLCLCMAIYWKVSS